MSDFIAYGWNQIAACIVDANGKRLFSTDYLRKKFGCELKSAKVVFEMQLRRGDRPRVCAWFSQLQTFFRVRGQKNWKKGPNSIID